MVTNQRFTETVINAPASGSNVQLCKEDYTRIVLIIADIANANFFPISTRPIPNGMSAGATIMNTSFPNPFRLTKKDDGILVAQAWFANTTVFAGNAFAVVFEVFEDNYEPRQTPSGIILAPDLRAVSLRRAIEAAIPKG